MAGLQGPGGSLETWISSTARFRRRVWKVNYIKKTRTRTTTRRPRGSEAVFDPVASGGSRLRSGRCGAAGAVKARHRVSLARVEGWRLMSLLL